jgi:hypothetical protein
VRDRESEGAAPIYIDVNEKVRLPRIPVKPRIETWRVVAFWPTLENRRLPFRESVGELARLGWGYVFGVTVSVWGWANSDDGGGM